MVKQWCVARKKYANDLAKTKRKGLLVDDALDVNMAMSLKQYTGVVT